MMVDVVVAHKNEEESIQRCQKLTDDVCFQLNAIKMSFARRVPAEGRICQQTDVLCLNVSLCLHVEPASNSS